MLFRSVVFCEPKTLYGLQGDVPEGDYETPIGEAAVRREGSDLSLVGIGATVGLALKAAEALAEEEISAEVIDLRSLSPLDEATVLRTLEKTGRLVVVHEAPGTCGFGAELLAAVEPGGRARFTIHASNHGGAFLGQLRVFPDRHQRARDVSFLGILDGSAYRQVRLGIRRVTRHLTHRAHVEMPLHHRPDGYLRAASVWTQSGSHSTLGPVRGKPPERSAPPASEIRERAVHKPVLARRPVVRHVSQHAVETANPSDIAPRAKFRHAHRRARVPVPGGETGGP